jgi:hypothetical protein
MENRYADRHGMGAYHPSRSNGWSFMFLGDADIEFPVLSSLKLLNC